MVSAKNKKILFLSTGNHPVHIAFANKIGADIRKISWNIPKGYDIYLVEGEFFIPIFLRFLRLLKKSSKIISLFADPRLYYHQNKIMFNGDKNKLEKKKKSRIFLFNWAIKKLDGALCEGKFNKSLFEKFNLNIPSRIIYPFISKKRYISLKQIKPSFDKNNIVFIGNGPDYYVKGLEELIKNFRILKRRNKNLKLFILGSHWNIKKEWLSEGITFEGRKNILPYLKTCAFAIYLGKGEAFGVSILESLLAGIPCFVSNEVGSYEVVENIDKSLIINLNESSISETIQKMLDSFNSVNLNKISKKCKTQASKFNENDVLREFEKQFENLRRNIENKNL